MAPRPDCARPQRPDCRAALAGSRPNCSMSRPGCRRGPIAPVVHGPTVVPHRQDNGPIVLGHGLVVAEARLPRTPRPDCRPSRLDWGAPFYWSRPNCGLVARRRLATSRLSICVTAPLQSAPPNCGPMVPNQLYNPLTTRCCYLSLLYCEAPPRDHGLLVGDRGSSIP